MEEALTRVLVNKKNAYTHNIFEIEVWAAVDTVNPAIGKDAIYAEIEKIAKEWFKFMLCLVPLRALLKALCNAWKNN